MIIFLVALFNHTFVWLNCIIHANTYSKYNIHFYWAGQVKNHLSLHCKHKASYFTTASLKTPSCSQCQTVTFRENVCVCVCVCVSVRTMLSKQVAVDDVNHAVQLLLHQTPQRNFENKLTEQLTREREREREREEREGWERERERERGREREKIERERERERERGREERERERERGREREREIERVSNAFNCTTRT